MTELIVEEAEYVVRITLTTTIGFSPIARSSRLTAHDAIANAYGTMPDQFWKDLEGEGWALDATAEKVVA